MDRLKGSTLDRVIAIAEYHSGSSNLSAETAVDQDMGICGDDIDEFAEALAKQLGGDIASWPWNRFCELNEPNMLTVFVFVWRLIVWPFRRRLSDPNYLDRLELGHIAAVIDRGEWFEP